MHVALLGGGGYIGTYLHHHLGRQGFKVHTYDPNPHPSLQPLTAIRASDIPVDELQTYDVVIFLAGLSGRASCDKVSEAMVIQENVEEILIIGRRMQSHQRLIYASSASLLEGSLDVPADEGYVVRTELLDSYARSMYQRECSVRSQMTIPTVGLRFGTVIGISPRQRYDLVHLAMIQAARRGDIVMTWPRCCRSILWMPDLLRAVTALIQETNPEAGHRIYNLASFNTDIQAIASEIVRQAPFRPIQGKLHIKYIPKDGDTVKSGFSMDTERFQKDFGKDVFQGTPTGVVAELWAHWDHLVPMCRVCKSSDMRTVLDLCSQPLANNYVSTPCQQTEYPLRLLRCVGTMCHHTQLSHSVDPAVLFQNYQYNSGTSWTLRNYFTTLARKVDAECRGDKAHPLVLELACNDGSQLDKFAELGWETLGVDPAENMAALARERGHTVLTEYWGQSKPFLNISKVPDAIVAQNVLAHVPDPGRFLEHCAHVMGPHTRLYIQTSQCNMYVNGEFDTLYHEHLSFFTISSMLSAADTVGLGVEEITKPAIHGTSYLFRMRKGMSHSPQALAAYKEEKEQGMYTDAFYNRYRERVFATKAWVIARCAELRKLGCTIIGYGAAAKGMTLLNFFGNELDLEYIIDDAPMKHYKYTPGTNIPIYPPAHLETPEETQKPLAILVFAWNFMEEIMKKIKALRGPGTTTAIVQPFPEQIVHNIY